MLFPPKTEKLRGIQAKQLRRIMNFKPGEDSIDAEAKIVPNNRFRFPDPYSRLAGRMYNDFYNRAVSSGDKRLVEVTETPVVLYGFHVVARILKAAPPAYVEYTAQSGQTKSVDELGQILKNSTGILDLFAGMDVLRNRVYEYSFGLKASANRLPVVRPFIVAPNEEERLHFTVNPDIQPEAEAEIQHQINIGDIKGEPKNYQKCPALGYVLKSQWSVAIDACMSDPHLFAWDIGVNTSLPVPELA